MKFLENVGNGSMNKRLNFGGCPDPDPFPDRDTGKTSLGGSMQCSFE